MTHPITKRHCHYCHQPCTAAFYLPDVRGWACPACYFEAATSNKPSSAGTKPSASYLMATSGAIDQLAELAGVA